MGSLSIFVIVMWKLYPLTGMLHPSGVNVETQIASDLDEAEIMCERARQLGFFARIDSYVEDHEIAASSAARA